MKNYQQLKKIFKRISQLQYLQRILMCDEAIMMPRGAGQHRANAMAKFNRIIHKMLINKKIKILIEEAKTENNLLSWDLANLQWMEKKYDRAACIPLQLTEKFTKASMASEQAWRQLRPKNNWQDFLPYLEQSFSLAKEIANRQAEVHYHNPYDAAIDQYAPGFNQKNIDPIFSALKTILPNLIQKIIKTQQVDNIKIPTGPFPVEKQKMLGLSIMQGLGFNFDCGRLDISHHPFCAGDPPDIRVTTRYLETEFLQSLLAVCHETGHALYEQGLPRKWIDQPVGRIQSMAMHESESLLLEMEICHSFSFYEYLIPFVRNYFGDQEGFTPENLYSLITKVKPGLIRVEADEVTYPLHIILRYEIEKSLFKGEINIKDLPRYWDELMTQYLGVSTKGNDQNGVMQDVHWTGGIFGYFPAYTLGRLIAAQLFATYKSIRPQYKDDIKEGNFQPLKDWLKLNVYDYASSLSTRDWLVKVTGKDLEVSDFVNHVEQRYGAKPA